MKNLKDIDSQGGIALVINEENLSSINELLREDDAELNESGGSRVTIST